MYELVSGLAKRGQLHMQGLGFRIWRHVVSSCPALHVTPGSGLCGPISSAPILVGWWPSQGLSVARVLRR